MEASNLQELLSSRSAVELALPYVPAWCLAFVLGRKYGRLGLSTSTARSAFHVDEYQGWLVLPILVWACTAAVRSFRFWISLAMSHGPDPREFLLVASSSLLACGFLCVIQVLAMGVKRGSVSTLGLSGLYRFVSVLVIAHLALEAYLLLAISAGFTQPAGLRFPL